MTQSSAWRRPATDSLPTPQLIGSVQTVHAPGLGLDEIKAVFSRWNEGKPGSYLIEITRDILGHRDEYGKPTLDLILDAAEQKGTGKWTVAAALDSGQPLTLMGEAVFARCLSALKAERVVASRVLGGPPLPIAGDRCALVDALGEGLYASKIVSYAQGFQLMRAVADESGWPLDYGRIALMWRGGCIIRSVFLGRIKEAFDRDSGLANLLLDPFFAAALQRSQEGWRSVVAAAVRGGIAVPAMSAALAYFDGYRCARGPANLLQAQRDYFGAHTYERIDQPRGMHFHTNWVGGSGADPSTSHGE